MNWKAQTSRVSEDAKRLADFETAKSPGTYVVEMLWKPNGTLAMSVAIIKDIWTDLRKCQNYAAYFVYDYTAPSKVDCRVNHRPWRRLSTALKHAKVRVAAALRSRKWLLLEELQKRRPQPLDDMKTPKPSLEKETKPADLKKLAGIINATNGPIVAGPVVNFVLASSLKTKALELTARNGGRGALVAYITLQHSVVLEDTSGSAGSRVYQTAYMISMLGKLLDMVIPVLLTISEERAAKR